MHVSSIYLTYYVPRQEKVSTMYNQWNCMFFGIYFYVFLREKLVFFPLDMVWFCEFIQICMLQYAYLTKIITKIPICWHLFLLSIPSLYLCCFRHMWQWRFVFCCRIRLFHFLLTWLFFGRWCHQHHENAKPPPVCTTQFVSIIQCSELRTAITKSSLPWWLVARMCGAWCMIS